MKIKGVLLILVFLIILKLTSAELYISEIMYHPVESDSYNEWIEIYNGGTEIIHIENLTLCNNHLFPGFVNHTDENIYLNNFTTIEPNQYAIITDGGSGTEVYDNYSVSQDSIAIHTEGGSMCNNGLNNDEEIITIYYNDELIDAIHYYSEWGADDNGRSLCSIENIWRECIPTPGSENIEHRDTTNYTLQITEFLPDPEGYDNAPMPEGEWIELFNYGEKEINLIGLILKDDANHKLIITGTTTTKETIEPQEYLAIYMNGFWGFLNNNGFEEITLLTELEEEITQITYYDSKEGNSWSLIGDFWKITKPSPNQENIDEDIEKNSKIRINKAYLGSDNQAKFGDNLRVRLDVYKGNTTKEEVRIYIKGNDEKISKITRFKISNVYTNHTLTVPIQIFPNCNSKYKDGIYKIIVEGLEEASEELIEIRGITNNLCGKVVETKIIDKDSKILINDSDVQSKEIFKSVSKQSERSAIYFFCFVLILVIIKTNSKKWKKLKLKQ